MRKSLGKKTELKKIGKVLESFPSSCGNGGGGRGVDLFSVERLFHVKSDLLTCWENSIITVY